MYRINIDYSSQLGLPGLIQFLIDCELLDFVDLVDAFRRPRGFDVDLKHTGAVSVELSSHRFDLFIDAECSYWETWVVSLVVLLLLLVKRLGLYKAFSNCVAQRYMLVSERMHVDPAAVVE